MHERTPNFGYHRARAEAGIARAAYAAALPVLAQRQIELRGELPFEVYSYSGQHTLPEQVASLRSLLRYAGRPRKFTVVSDGTYSPRSRALLRSISDVVQIADVPAFVPSDFPAPLRSYLTTHSTGKQLAVIMSLPVGGPALYVDSDVLFFRGAATLQSRRPAEAPAQYLADCQLSVDERLFRSSAEKVAPVNTGVLFLDRPVDWSRSIERFLQLEGPPTFFTNQSMAHLTMHANGAQPLDPDHFVLQLDDQFVHEDRHAGSELVSRHYVNPVRHKFWNALVRRRRG